MSVPLEKGAVMQRYESYKASGVEWLGDVPSHWDVKPLRAVTELKSDRNRPDLPVLSVYREYGVILKDSRDDNHNATSLDTSNYKVVKPGDLVVNKMKAWQGSMGVSAHEGIVSPDYITCSTNAERVQSNYLHYLLRSALLISVYNALSYGVRVGQWDMHYEDFKQISIPLPPYDEQNCIIAFLDQKTVEIDAAIAKKE
ncbi:MAG: restriction endonuclease subunit S, partial [Polaromonas sp.]|nr:restriction endonuclease subunit S [Polaromonas sp.]